MNSLPNSIKGLMLLSGLLFFSCKKDTSSLTLPGDPEIPANTLYSDTFSVQISTALVYEDFITYKTTRGGVPFLMVGGYSNAETGNDQVKAFAQLELEKQYVDLTDATVDSCFLELDYNYYLGDTLETQTLEVYQLDQQIQSDENYRINSPAPAYSTLLGSKAFNAFPVTGTNIRIPITNTSFVNSIVSGPKNNADFISQFKGVAIVPTSADGAVFRVNLASSLTGMFIYYKQNGENKTYAMSINSERYYTSTKDLSSTNLAVLTNEYDVIPSATTGNKAFLQGASGLRTKITFPYLKNFVEEQGYISIHKAQLFIPAAGNSLPDSLYLIRLDEDGTIAYNSGSVSTVQKDVNPVNGLIYPQHATFASFDQAYKFELRNYLQNTMYGEIPDNGLLLSSSNINISLNGAGVLDQNNISDKIKLKLYYTLTK